METDVKSTGYINVRAEIEDDDINYDNKRYTNLFIPKEIPVLIFSNTSSDSRFVKLALTASGNDRPIQITEKNLNQLSSYNLSNYDAVIVIGSEVENNIERLKPYVESGGGLFLMPGENSNINNFKKFTETLGIASPTKAVGKLNDNTNSVRFDKVEYNHPIFQDIFSNKEKKNVESPEIYYHFDLKAGINANEIISLIDGSSFLSDYKIGKGKVLLMNTAPVLSWSNFPIKSIFVPLMNKAVYYLSSKDRNENNFIAGSAANIRLPEISSPQLRIITPDKTEEYINLEDSSNMNYLIF